MESQILDIEFNGVGQSEVKYAGFWRRTGATLLDGIVLLPLIGLNYYNLYSIKSLPLQLVLTLIMAAYKPFMEFYYGATFGKMMARVRVIDANFNNMTLSQSLVRNSIGIAGYLISIYTTIVLFSHPEFMSIDSMLKLGTLQQQVQNPALTYIPSLVLFVACFAVVFTKKKQGLHDLMAKTYCITK